MKINVALKTFLLFYHNIFNLAIFFIKLVIIKKNFNIHLLSYLVQTFLEI